MEAVKVIFIILAVLVSFGVVLMITLSVKATIDAEKVLKYEKRDGRFTRKLLSTNFSNRTTMYNVLLPFGPGGKTSGPADAIVVLRGGIAVIKTQYARGYIDNPFRGEWCQYNKGDTETLPNPFDLNEASVTSVKTIMQREEIYNVPIHNIILFVSKGVKFKNREETLLAADGLIPYLKDLSKNRFLTTAEVTKVTEVLRKYRRHPKNAQKNANSRPPLLTSGTGANNNG